jgi:hypothetical protein
VTTYTPRTWADAELAKIGAPVTPNTEQTLVDWEAAEGGAGPEWGIPGNITDYNPINISLTSGAQGYGYDPGTGAYYPGARPTPGNNPPIAAFSDWQTGIDATAARLEEPFAAQILADLKSNAPEASTSSAVAGSGWGTGNFAGLNAKGTASGSGPAGSSSAAASSAAGTATPAANATLTNFNANPFDLFGIPQTIVGGAANSAAGAVWSLVGPFIVKAMLVTAGLAVVIVGLKVTAGEGERDVARDAGPELKRAGEAAAPAAEAAA